MASDGDVGANAEIEFEIPKSEQKIPDLVQIDGKGMYHFHVIFIHKHIYSASFYGGEPFPYLFADWLWS